MICGGVDARWPKLQVAAAIVIVIIALYRYDSAFRAPRQARRNLRFVLTRSHHRTVITAVPEVTVPPSGSIITPHLLSCDSESGKSDYSPRPHDLSLSQTSHRGCEGKLRKPRYASVTADLSLHAIVTYFRREPSLSTAMLRLGLQDCGKVFHLLPRSPLLLLIPRHANGAQRSPQEEPAN